MLRFVIFALMVCFANGDRDVLQWDGWNPIGGEGMVTDRYINYQVPQTGNPGADGYLVCYDASLDIICLVSTDVRLLCYNNMLQEVLDEYILRDSIVCSTEFHYLIYLVSDGNDNCSLKRFNLDTKTNSFNIPVAGNPYSSSLDPFLYDGNRWLIDDSLGLFYTVSTTSAVYNSGPLISSSTETGEVITTSNSVVPIEYETGYSPMKIAFDHTIMGLQYDQSITLFDATTLLLKCTIPYHAPVKTANTDGSYLFISYDGGEDVTDFYAYDSSCRFQWRIPFPSAPKSFSFSYNNDGSIYIVNPNGDSGSSFVYKVKSDTGDILAQCVTNNDSYQFGGADLYGNLFFYDVSTSSAKLFIKQYQPALDGKVGLSQHISLDADVDWSTFIGLTNGGAFLIVASYYQDPETHITGKIGSFFLISASSSTSGQRLNNILSWCVFAISLMVALFLLAKHTCCGEDPEGWNKKKIPEVLGLLLTAVCLIIITISSMYVQFGIVQDINSQTAIFDDSTSSFFSANVEPCNDPSQSGTALDYCTCLDEDDLYRQIGCVANACDSAFSASCSTLLSTSCDCLDSFYQWTCDCQYGDSGQCSAVQTTTTSINADANRQWNSCKNSYFYPTLLLRISLWTAVVSACIVLLLNALQLLSKFDVTALDIITTCFSIFSAVLVFLLLVLGNFMARRAGGDCIAEFIATLPGCVLNSNGLVLSSNEAVTQANLHAAYRDLLISPFILLVSAIPDLLSCCFCCPSGICRSKRSGYETIY